MISIGFTVPGAGWLGGDWDALKLKVVGGESGGLCTAPFGRVDGKAIGEPKAWVDEGIGKESVAGAVMSVGDSVGLPAVVIR